MATRKKIIEWIRKEVGQLISQVLHLRYDRNHRLYMYQYQPLSNFFRPSPSNSRVWPWQNQSCCRWRFLAEPSKPSCLILWFMSLDLKTKKTGTGNDRDYSWGATDGKTRMKWVKRWLSGALHWFVCRRQAFLSSNTLQESHPRHFWGDDCIWLMSSLQWHHGDLSRNKNADERYARAMTKRILMFDCF